MELVGLSDASSTFNRTLLENRRQKLRNSKEGRGGQHVKFPFGTQYSRYIVRDSRIRVDFITCHPFYVA